MRLLDIAESIASERLERARKLGFDVSRRLYHGTGRAFAAFKRSAHGQNMGAHNREPFAVWLTSSPEVAGVYAFNTTQDSHHFLSGELLRKGDGMPTIMPLFVRTEGFHVVDCTDWTHFKLLRNKGDILRGAKEGSRFVGPPSPGVIFRNAEDGTEHRSDIYAVFNPARVRSVFANFDPAKRNSSDLMA